jgi:hypothetical protein
MHRCTVRCGHVYLGTSLSHTLILPPAYPSPAVISTLFFGHKHFQVAFALVSILIHTLTQLAALARLPFINAHDNLAMQLSVEPGAALAVPHFFRSTDVASGVCAPPNMRVQALARAPWSSSPRS